MTPREFIYSVMSAAGTFNPTTHDWPAHWELEDGSLIGLEAVERCNTADDLYDLLHMNQAEVAEMAARRARIWQRIQSRTGLR